MEQAIIITMVDHENFSNRFDCRVLAGMVFQQLRGENNLKFGPTGNRKKPKICTKTYIYIYIYIYFDFPVTKNKKTKKKLLWYYIRRVMLCMIMETIC